MPVLIPIDSPAAWRGRDLVERDDWSLALEPQQLREIDEAVARAETLAQPLPCLERSDFPLPAFEPLAERILESMENGLGFVRLRGLPVARWGEARTRLALWGLGTHLGWAEPQDAAGSLMHDVRDTGRKFGSDDRIRYFQTSQAIDFHNDGADVFVLCCLRGGASGGLSRIVSAVEIFNTIVRQRPDLAAVLQQDFHVDARGQHPEGARCQVIPIYAFQDGQPSILLKLEYVRSAQRFDDVPRLSSAQLEALELLVSVMESDGMALEFQLEPGDALIASNHVTLHGRTAFTDRPGPDEHRHMLRLWLTIPNGRPLPAHYAHTREFASTYARRVARGVKDAPADVR